MKNVDLELLFSKNIINLGTYGGIFGSVEVDAELSVILDLNYIHSLRLEKWRLHRRCRFKIKVKC